VTDFLAEKRREINDRLAELKPLIDEYTQLEAAGSQRLQRRRQHRRAGPPWTRSPPRLQEQQEHQHRTAWPSARRGQGRRGHSNRDDRRATAPRGTP
jgi:hypothetical protein